VFYAFVWLLKIKQVTKTRLVNKITGITFVTVYTYTSIPITVFLNAFQINSTTTSLVMSPIVAVHSTDDNVLLLHPFEIINGRRLNYNA